MDLDDLFGKHRRGKRGHHDHDDHDYRGHDQDKYHGHHDDDRGYYRGESRRYREHHEHDRHGGELFDIEHLAYRLLSNKKLLLFAGVALLGILALAAIFVLPLLGQAVGYVDKSGLQGVAERVWQGTGGGK